MAARRDFGTLVINRLIIHEVHWHRRGDQESEPTYSDVESPLDNDLRIFFRGKIIETSGSPTAYEVVFVADSKSPVPELVRDFLDGGKRDFVEISKTIAMHLQSCQDGVNPGGLVTVIDCQFSGKPALGILKLEKEQGVRLSQTEHQGKKTFNVLLIRDLILTKKTKLFKIGLFF